MLDKLKSIMNLSTQMIDKAGEVPRKVLSKILSIGLKVALGLACMAAFFMNPLVAVGALAFITFRKPITDKIVMPTYYFAKRKSVNLFQKRSPKKLKPQQELTKKESKLDKSTTIDKRDYENLWKNIDLRDEHGNQTGILFSDILKDGKRSGAEITNTNQNAVAIDFMLKDTKEIVSIQIDPGKTYPLSVDDSKERQYISSIKNFDYTLREAEPTQVKADVKPTKNYSVQQLQKYQKEVAEHKSKDRKEPALDLQK